MPFGSRPEHGANAATALPHDDLIIGVQLPDLKFYF